MKGRNAYYQKQTGDQVLKQADETLSLLTDALNIHLNIGQNFTVNTSSTFLVLGKVLMRSLTDRLIPQVAGGQVRLPSTLYSNQTSNSTVSFRVSVTHHSSWIYSLVSLQSMMNRLAVADRSATAPYTNLSRSISFSILDRDGNDVAVATNTSQPIEIIIPRDVNLLVPPMILQNVTASSLVAHAQTFNLHYANLSAMTASFSIHLQLRPMNSNLSYLLIYKFDQSPRLNSSITDIDGWTLLCSSDLHTYFLDNQQTTGRRSIIFGIRQLTTTEANRWCTNSSSQGDPPRSDQPFRFTDNYELRLYTSGCYYLDVDHRWRSDLLQVGPLTNLSQTQCLSSHLTTFAGGFLVLPTPINWNYVFANADFAKNKTIYLTVICAALLYLILAIYARFQDKKDIEKVHANLYRILAIHSMYDNSSG